MLITILEFLLKATQFLMLAIFGVFAFGVIVVMYSVLAAIFKGVKVGDNPAFMTLISENRKMTKKLTLIWILELVVGTAYIGIAYFLALLKK